MANSVIGEFFTALFQGFGEAIAYVIIIAALVLFALLILLFVFSGTNIIILLRKNRKKGIILLILFIASIVFAFNKIFYPIILLSLYFVISLIISLIKKIIQFFKKKIK